MKFSRITRFVRVNLVGLLALANVGIVFFKFRIESPKVLPCKCSLSHSLTNNVKSSAVPSTASPVASVGVTPVPVSHFVSGDWEGDLKEVQVPYWFGQDGDGFPILQMGDGLFYRRGDLTRWGRLCWIGRDFAITEKNILVYGSTSVGQVVKNEGAL